jgi:hypothetical protein
VWDCQCECGAIQQAFVTQIKKQSLKCKNCGSIQNHPLKKVWDSMRSRCRHYSSSRKYYYDKGISVCERWEDFKNFVEDMGERPEGYTLERIDSTKGYSPENCKWASYSEQNRNRDISLYNTFSHNGETKTLIEWSNITGMTVQCLSQRIKRGWPSEAVLSKDKYSWRLKNAPTVIKRSTRTPLGLRELLLLICDKLQINIEELT